MDAAGGRALDAHDLIELRRIEVDGWRRAGRGCRRVEWRLAGRKRRADHARHFYGVTVTADMHVEGCRRGTQHVIVYSRDVEPALEQLCHDRRDFGLQQHQVAHHHGFAMRRRECDPTSECKRGLNGHSVERHMQIGTRQSVAVDLSGNRGSLAQSGIDIFPIDFGGFGYRGQRRGDQRQDYQVSFHRSLLGLPQKFDRCPVRLLLPAATRSLRRTTHPER